MIKIGNSEPKAIYIGSTPVKEVWCGSKKVWPIGPEYTYVVDNFVLHYSSYIYLYVNTNNYAYITATQKKVNRQGSVVETTTVTMTPEFSSGTNFYSISGTQIKFNIDTYGTTEINERSSDKFIGTYTDPNGVVHTIPTANALSVTLQGNHRQEPAVLDSVTLNLSANPTSVDCKATSTTAYVSFTRTFHYVYTSGKSSGAYSDHAGTAALYVGSTLKANVGNDSSTVLTFADNKHNTSTSSKTIKAVYNGVEKTVEIKQGVDKKNPITGEIVPNSYFCSFTKSGSITAGGGSVTFEVSAGHQTQDYYIWDSDKTDTKDPHTYHNVADSYSYETSTLSSRCHLSSVSGGYKISHDSMQKDETTDSYRIRFYNTASSTYSGWDSGSATNTKSISAFTINVPSSVSALGETIQITGKPTYSWTSGATEQGATVNAETVAIQSPVPTWARVVSSSKIQVDENESTSDRRLTFRATFSGKTDTVGATLKQNAATVEYRLTTIGLVYTGGLSYLHPSHSNYAYLTGHWERYVNGRYRDYTTVTLTPSYSSDRLKTEDTTKIYWSWEHNYGITNLSQQTISGLSGSYSGQTVSGASVVVGANRIESTTETPTAYSNVRTNPSTVPTAGLTFNTVDVWDRDAYTISGDLTYDITQTYTSTKTHTFSASDEHRMAQSYSIPSEYSSWLSADGKKLTVSANSAFSQRSATFTAYYGSVAGTVTLTQQARVIEFVWEITNIGNGYNKERWEDYSDIAQYTPAGEERKFALSQDGTLVIGVKITNNTSTSKTIYASETTMEYAYNAAYSGWASWPTGAIQVTDLKWAESKGGVMTSPVSSVTIPANSSRFVLFRVEGLLGYSQGTRTAWQIYTGDAIQRLTIKNLNDEKYKTRVGLRYDG